MGKKTVSTLKDKLIKMTKEVYGRFDDYSISPKIRQIYWIGAMNYLKVTFCNSFCCPYENELLFFKYTRIIAKSKRWIS